MNLRYLYYKLRELLYRPFIPFVILIFGIIFTAISGYTVQRQIEEKDKARFDNGIERIQTNIHGTLDTYTALIRATAGFVAADKDITKDKFYVFTQKLGLPERYPGLRGLGYALRIKSEQKDEILANLQNEWDNNFTIRPEIPRQEYYPIIYLEPQDIRNKAAVGYDMFTEKNRQAAMALARDTGSAVMSSKVTLVQEIDKNKQPGFLIYIPIYSNGNIPESVEERRNELKGFAYSPLRVGEFFDAIVKNEKKSGIDFTVYDGKKATPDKLLFQSTPTGKKTGVLPHIYNDQKTLAFSQNTWTIVYNTNPAFDAGSNRNILYYVFTTGILFSLVLFFLSRLQYIAQRKRTAILEGIADGFISFDKKWNITYVNKEVLRVANRQHEKMIGRNFWRLFPQAGNMKIGRSIKRAMHDGKPSSIEEYYPQIQAWYAVRIYPSQFGLSLFFQNITKRKELERQKDEFIGIVSHELKTPVTSIKAFTQILLKRFTETKDKTSALFMSKMDVQITKLTGLINDLLDVTRIESGKLQFNEEIFDFNSLVSEVVEEMQHITSVHKIEVHLSKTQNIYGDRDRIGQVITNFLSNAIKYSQRASKIIVRSSKSGKFLTFSVQDFGLGISRKEQRMIFNRFYRVRGPNSTNIPGIGLGLFVSKEIITRHNGKIWVESTEGKGATFFFTLPVSSKHTK